MNTSKEQSPLRTVWAVAKFIFSKLGSFIATFFMVGIITGCIVACVLTVYVLQSIGSEPPVTLDSAKRGYTSIILAKNEQGEDVEVKNLYIPNNNRIPVTLDEISPNVVNAVIAIEDKRFTTRPGSDWEHQGVDWVRTMRSFLNMFIPGATKSGGSTIHQQLIKNITGDDDVRIDRKVREIFRALNLAQSYTKDQVMEAYLNVASFGAGTNGIEAAANVYFDKTAKELTVAESAAIVGITQKPTAYNPMFYPEANEARRKDVLFFMHEYEMIDDATYEAALVEKLNFKSRETVENVLEPTSYFEDYVIDSVIADLMVKKGYDNRADASNDLYMGGYRIHTTQNLKEQKRLEEFYLTSGNFPKIARVEYPQSGAVITTHDGAVIAMVGGIGPKTESRSFNRITMAKRQPGSTFKPIGSYALGFQYNLITPSTIIQDTPINPDAPQAEWYPKNYYGGYLGPVTVERAIIKSINTVAVKVTQMVTPQALFEFFYYDLSMTSLIEPNDIDIAPMALGGLTEGVTPLELTGAYQMIVNGGNFTKPYGYTHVTDSDGRTVLKSDTTPRRVISEDTAILLNKMTQEVVKTGTGYDARLANGMPTGGKTGTSNEDVDQWFVGFTPYYLCTVWLGYDKPNYEDKYGTWTKNSVFYLPNPYPTPILFKSVMDPLHEDLDPTAKFLESDEVVQKIYCTITGNQATTVCPNATTWYKASNLPPICNGQHGDPAKPDDEGEGSDEGTSSSGGSNVTTTRPSDGSDTSSPID